MDTVTVTEATTAVEPIPRYVDLLMMMNPRSDAHALVLLRQFIDLIYLMRPLCLSIPTTRTLNQLSTRRKSQAIRQTIAVRHINPHQEA